MQEQPSPVHVEARSQAIPAVQPKAEEGTILIMGASGDLTARKLMPALFALRTQGFLSEGSPAIGVARRKKTDHEFRGEMRAAVEKHARIKVTESNWNAFARRLFYRQVDLANPGEFETLAARVNEIERRVAGAGLSAAKEGPVGEAGSFSGEAESLRGEAGRFAYGAARRVVYLATSPELFLPAAEGLARGGLIPPSESEGWLRVVIEKPFGHDLESARRLSSDLGRLLTEDQIYRIDHYLGKETVQNILLFRFGNGIFEPLMNRRHVDHVQITVAESQGIERGRGGYYDQSGALRDVLQNHVLQLLCLTAMEPPARFLARNIRDETLKVLDALAPGRTGDVSRWTVAGQYAAGELNGEPAGGYRGEDRVSPDSRRETYVAMNVRVDNWRWGGVPFYLRTGKRLPERVTEIAIQFKLPPLHLFTTVECEGDLCDLVEARPNTLVFRIQPSEAISLMFSCKRPGMQYQIHPVTMDFNYDAAFEQGLPEAYERLLLDVLRGDSTLFTRSDELEAAWRFVDPVLAAWERPDHVPEPYPAGSWGPAAADRLLAAGSHRWRRPAGLS